MKRILSIFLAALLATQPALSAVIATVKAGATSQSITIHVNNATTGLPDEGKAYNSSGIALKYWVHGANAATSITPATQTVSGAYSSGGFVVLGLGDGTYRLDIPNAALSAAGMVDVGGVITGDFLIGGTILVSPPVDVDTIKTNPVVNGGTITFPTGATLASTANITTVGAIGSGGISEASFATTAGNFNHLGITDQGTAQAVSATTLQLRSAAAFPDSQPIGYTILLTNGTNAGATAVVSSYVGSTDTATFSAWSGGVTPTGTPTYEVFGTAPASASGALTANVTQWNGTNVSSPATAGVPNVNVINFGGSAGTFASGIPAVNTTKVGGTSQTARDLGASVLLSSGTGTGQLSLSSGAVLLQATQTGVTIPTVTTVTNAGSDTSGTTTLLSRLSATRAGYLDNLSVAAPTAATNAAAVWDLATTGHTTSGTFGAAMGAAGAAGDPWSTSLPGAYGAGTAGNILGNRLDAAISSRMATYTQPTGFLGATFPSGTVANTTNITAGTITTATNLTNAPTAGDLTATMKTSVQTAAAAALTAYDAPTRAEATSDADSILTRLGTPVISVSDDIAALKTAVDAILVDTGTTLDAKVTAIKAVTDQFTFSVTGKVDSNVTHMNEVEVKGDGTAAHPWNGE